MRRDPARDLGRPIRDVVDTPVSPGDHPAVEVFDGQGFSGHRLQFTSQGEAVGRRWGSQAWCKNTSSPRELAYDPRMEYSRYATACDEVVFRGERSDLSSVLAARGPRGAGMNANVW